MVDAAKVWRIAVWGTAGAILLAAAAASRTVAGFNWTGFDFAAAAAILGMVCLGFELATRSLIGHAPRFAAGLGLLGAFLVVWINLAVGIIGAEDNRANLVFFPVLLLGAGGAIWARFQPRGMAKVMTVAATYQVLLAAGLAGAGLPGAAMLTLGIGGLWGLSALLYHRAVRGQHAWMA
ncbi:hypothetical protein [Novosphingobium sp. B 225]|uniref:hypothetical protein n=1 Tax=Novosphingobium sp. B 225 TaxID=1961849 RepID=UPI000B4AA71D|nr:hypothetical protein [Novosphingobium sp. B 225]